MNRRTFLFTTSTIIATPNLLLGSLKEGIQASKQFSIHWRNINVGHSRIKVTRDGKKLRTEIDVKLNVKFFGINFYTYALKNRELWQEGLLTKLYSEAQENRKKVELNVFRDADELLVVGSKFNGKVSKYSGTTSYFTSDFLLKKLWINTHNGEPIKVDFKMTGDEKILTFSGQRTAKKWVNSGELDLSLFYDDKGDWIGSAFPVRGEQATMVLSEEINSINALWKQTLN